MLTIQHPETKPLKISHPLAPASAILSGGDRFLMPWCGCIATKIIWKMAQHLERHPGMKATSISSRRSSSNWMNISAAIRRPSGSPNERPAADLTDAEKDIMLANFFRAECGTVIRSSPRYAECLHSL